MLTVAQIVTRDVAGPRHRVWAPSISTRPCCHDGEAINSKCHMHAVDLPIVLAGASPVQRCLVAGETQMGITARHGRKSHTAQEA